MIHPKQKGYLTDERLVTWLLHHKHYEAFLEALHSPQENGNVPYNPSDSAWSINNACIWAHTPQGSNYWEDVHDKYVAYVTALQDGTQKALPSWAPTGDWFLQNTKEK